MNKLFEMARRRQRRKVEIPMWPKTAFPASDPASCAMARDAVDCPVLAEYVPQNPAGCSVVQMDGIKLPGSIRRSSGNYLLYISYWLDLKAHVRWCMIHRLG